ncbi:MAG: type II toxin-antitoxin system HicA family toxin [Candidatus Woykebacteria bacterium]
MKLPVVSGNEFVKRVKSKGFIFEKQEGSHMMLRLTQHPFTKLSVPRHKELSKGLLRRLLRDADITVEEFGKLK